MPSISDVTKLRETSRSQWLPVPIMTVGLGNSDLTLGFSGALTHIQPSLSSVSIRKEKLDSVYLALDTMFVELILKFSLYFSLKQE